DDKTTQRPVKVGESVGDSVSILEGLKPGERIVVEGLQKVRQDAPVQPMTAGQVSQAETTNTLSKTGRGECYGRPLFLPSYRRNGDRHPDRNRRAGQPQALAHLRVSTRQPDDDSGDHDLPRGRGSGCNGIRSDAHRVQGERSR